MANRYKMVDNRLVQLTDEEEAVKVAEEQAWVEDAPNRRMTELRRQRDVLLAETDWMANSDVTMSTAWKNYRQALRDITKTYKSMDDEGFKFPEKPTD